MMSKKFYSDLKRNPNGGYVVRFLYFLRLAQQTANPFIRLLSKVILRRYRLKYGLEISPMSIIGKGLYLGHAYNITVNHHATIGDNCNLHKGVLIGRENRGARKGCPTLGNCVWVGINAAIVGNVTIGDDVLIAPNTYINCNIPPHSICYGNPVIIKHRDNATENYINNRV